jgi:hypothetical protein
MLTEACSIRVARIDGTPMLFGDMPDAYRRGAYHAALGIVYRLRAQ